MATSSGAAAQMLSVYEAAYQAQPARPSRISQVLIDTVRAGQPVSFALGVQPNVAATVRDRVLVTRISPCGGGMIEPPMAELVSVTPRTGTTTVLEPAFSPGCAFQSNDVLTEGALASEFPTDNVGPIDLGRNPGDSFTIETWIQVPGATDDFQTIIEKSNPRNYGLYIAPVGPRAGRLHFSYQPEGETFFCPSYSQSRVDDGSPHHIALRFRRLPSGRRRIQFFIDGVLDQSRSTCTPAGPAVNGEGGSAAAIGARLAAGGRIGEIRLSHYSITDAQIAVHAAGGP